MTAELQIPPSNFFFAFLRHCFAKYNFRRTSFKRLQAGVVRAGEKSAEAGSVVV